MVAPVVASPLHGAGFAAEDGRAIVGEDHEVEHGVDGFDGEWEIVGVKTA